MFAACVINIWKKDGKPKGIHILSLLFCYFPPKHFFQPCTSSIPYPTSVSCRCLQQVPSATGNSPAKVWSCQVQQNNFILELQHPVEMQLCLYFHVDITDWKMFY